MEGWKDGKGMMERRKRKVGRMEEWNAGSQDNGMRLDNLFYMHLGIQSFTY